MIIAGAGGAAHLPGMVAALTPLPVIGVPVKPAGAHLDGLDALLSIVQVLPHLLCPKPPPPEPWQTPCCVTGLKAHVKPCLAVLRSLSLAAIVKLGHSDKSGGLHACSCSSSQWIIGYVHGSHM